ncbi:MAG: pyridoxal phosphate-dependent aminotransferase [Patescibacteria group bacterium]|nr:pyridoxal phosphate-dependent aminotransferase [Patescibacteria group bacterium]
MPKPNQSLLALPSSGIRKVMALSANVPGCIHLEVGQPDFRTPKHILEAASDAALTGFTRYTAGAGIQELREAIAAKVFKKNGFRAGPENIVVSPGAVASIMTALRAVVTEGEEVLLPDPGWPNYAMQVACLGAKPVYYPLNPATGFQPDFDALGELITRKTKVIIINTPANPTGAVFSKETMREIMLFAQSHDIYVVSDEVYEDFVFDGEHTSAGIFDPDGRAISIFGFSKSYAATGLRIGCAVCERSLAELITKLQEPFFSCACGISQKAYLAALTGPQECVKEMAGEYRKRRDEVVRILKERGFYLYTPQGAFYILIDISASGLGSDEFTLKLLKEKKVAVAPGETFGDISSSFVRVSLATSQDDLIQGVSRICDLVNELRS